MSEPETNGTPAERKVRLARLSGKETAAWMVSFLLLIGFLIPNVVGLPLWLDFEIVLAAWWMIWLVVLTRLLYTGQRITADHELGAPRNWLGMMTNQAPPRKDPLDIRKPEATDSSGSWWYFGPADPEGCGILIAIVLGVVVLFGLIWFLVEIAIPIVIFVLYLVVRGMLAHVINDRHHCRGSLGRAMAWAFVWATVYMAPLAGVIWFVHHVVSRQPVA